MAEAAPQCAPKIIWLIIYAQRARPPNLGLFLETSFDSHSVSRRVVEIIFLISTTVRFPGVAKGKEEREASVSGRSNSSSAGTPQVFILVARRGCRPRPSNRRWPASGQARHPSHRTALQPAPALAQNWCRAAGHELTRTDGGGKPRRDEATAWSRQDSPPRRSPPRQGQRAKQETT